MFHLVLVHPEIPPNTGNIIRLCANTGAQLHLVHPLGFDMTDKQLRRAGLDYHEYAPVHQHASWQAFLDQCPSPPDRCFAMTTRAQQHAFAARFQAGDCLIFGSETRGLPQDILDGFAPSQRLKLPMVAGQRSLNLSNAAAVITYEAWRQLAFGGADTLSL